MSGKKNTKYTNDFKQTIVNLYNSGKTYSQIQKETTDEWRRKLLHTVAAKKPSSKGYDLTDDERDDLYK